jgi:hypothetical protein
MDEVKQLSGREVPSPLAVEIRQGTADIERVLDDVAYQAPLQRLRNIATGYL